MRALFDTSVLVNAIIAELSGHSDAAALLKKAGNGELELFVASHALAETFSALSTLPLSPRISAGQATRLLELNVLDRCTAVTLDALEYGTVLSRMSTLGLSGGIVYDALHVRAAEVARVEKLYTFNRRDFIRIPPEPPVELVIL